jgi:hypothetical protein
VAENMMSGKVHVKGFASNGAGASAHGGLLVIEGDAGLRCGISLKGGDIVVGGSVGSFSVHGPGRPHGDLRRCRRRAGRFALRGRALREAARSSRSAPTPQSKPMTDADIAAVGQLLGSRPRPRPQGLQAHRLRQRSLYHWNADANQEY